ncbi:TVP38/TMEM64 family protein [Methylophilus sp. 3sh_L]|uniref:TVP38/TMEM64 family protein n=1 Tax=Methylophilus sp. 3sh_L TaxID=3377114 RepID=UPI00398E6734
MRNHFKIIIFAAIWLALFCELIFDAELKQSLHTYLELHPVMAPILLILLQLTFTIFVLPCSTLTILAGILWGVKLGIIYSTLATLMSSSLTFFLGRYSFLNTKIINSYSSHQWGAKINQLLSRFNLWASALAHVNPLFPGSSLGYIFGTTNISYGAFILGAAIGTMPLQLMMVLIGDLSIKAFLNTAKIQSLAIIALLVAILGIYLIILPKILKKKTVKNDDNSLSS